MPDKFYLRSDVNVACRFEMRRAAGDYTAPSPVVSLLVTSTPSARRRVRSHRHTHLSRTPTLCRMDPIDIRLIKSGSRQTESFSSRRLHGRGGSRGTEREPDHGRREAAAARGRVWGHTARTLSWRLRARVSSSVVVTTTRIEINKRVW